MKIQLNQGLSIVTRDSGFGSVVKHLVEKKDSVYNSIDIYTRYVKESGKLLSKKELILKIVEKFGGDMITLSSPGIASILVLKSSAASIPHDT